MKKIMMTMVAAMMALTMNAQGNMYVGGSLGYQTSSYDGSSTRTIFTFSPSFGYWFKENLALGIELGYGSNTNEATDPNLTNSSLSVSPYVRYKAIQLGKVSLFADGMFTYSTSNNESAGADGKAQDNKVNGWGIYVKPGIAYSLNDKFSLVARFGNAIGYSSSKPDVSGAKATTTFQLANLSNNMQFGFFYNF